MGARACKDEVLPHAWNPFQLVSRFMAQMIPQQLFEHLLRRAVGWAQHQEQVVFAHKQSIFLTI